MCIQKSTRKTSKGVLPPDQRYYLCNLMKSTPHPCWTSRQRHWSCSIQKSAALTSSAGRQTCRSPLAPQRFQIAIPYALLWLFPGPWDVERAWPDCWCSEQPEALQDIRGSNRKRLGMTEILNFSVKKITHKLVTTVRQAQIIDFCNRGLGWRHWRHWSGGGGVGRETTGEPHRGKLQPTKRTV